MGRQPLLIPLVADGIVALLLLFERPILDPMNLANEFPIHHEPEKVTPAGSTVSPAEGISTVSRGEELLPPVRWL